jgi:hypothetical protein
MKVFLSWSGDLSHEVAEAFHKYLPLMFREMDPFLSSHDIGSGDRWSKELAASLDQTNFGLIFLTRDNLTTPWLLFEAGALTRHAEGRACCMLLDGLPLSEVRGPLAQFQNKQFSKTNVRVVVRDLTRLLPRSPESDQFDLIFEKWWPDIETAYNRALAARSRAPSTNRAPRAADDILQEVLVLTREIAARVTITSTTFDDPLAAPVTDATIERYTKWKFADKPVSEQWQRRLLVDLDFAKYPTIRHIHDTVEAAWPALEAFSAAEPALFGYGTDYITKALGFMGPAFRSRHGFSPTSREAFQNYAHLLDRSPTDPTA